MWLLHFKTNQNINVNSLSLSLPFSLSVEHSFHQINRPDMIVLGVISLLFSCRCWSLCSQFSLPVYTWSILMLFIGMTTKAFADASDNSKKQKKSSLLTSPHPSWFPTSLFFFLPHSITSLYVCIPHSHHTTKNKNKEATTTTTTIIVAITITFILI